MEFKHWLETLDTRPSFRQFSFSDGTHASYLFVLIRTPLGLVPVPATEKKGMRHLEELESIMGKRKEDIRALRFEVTFSPTNQEEYPFLKEKMDISRVVEMHFSRQETVPELMLVPGGARVGWKPLEQPRDDDVGDLSTSDALKVFSNVAEIAKEYVKAHSPRGIVIGTSPAAKPARASIYQRMIRRFLGAGMTASDLGGEARVGLKNSTIVWLDP